MKADTKMNLKRRYMYFKNNWMEFKCVMLKNTTVYFTSDLILNISMIISRLAKYVIMQVFACREEEVIATAGKRGIKENQDLTRF